MLLVGTLVLSAVTCGPGAAVAAVPLPPAPDEPAIVSYEDSRLQFRSADGRFAAKVQQRLQFRYAYPFDGDPRSPTALNETSSSFFIRRARLKLDGHAFGPWLQWYMQYDWAQPVLRDFSLTVSKVPWFRVLLGQRKVFWNDERVTS